MSREASPNNRRTKDRPGPATDRGAAGLLLVRHSRDGLRAMSADVKWIVGTGIGVIGTIVGTGLVLAGLMSAQFAGVNTRFDDVIARETAEHAEIRTEIRRMANRLHTLSLAVKPAPPANQRSVPRSLDSPCSGP